MSLTQSRTAYLERGYLSGEPVFETSEKVSAYPGELSSEDGVLVDWRFVHSHSFEQLAVVGLLPPRQQVQPYVLRVCS